MPRPPPPPGPAPALADAKASAPTVLVVGAGLSGAVAARVLARSGLRVKVVEEQESVRDLYWDQRLPFVFEEPEFNTGFLSELGMRKELVPVPTPSHGALVNSFVVAHPYIPRDFPSKCVWDSFGSGEGAGESTPTGAQAAWVVLGERLRNGVFSGARAAQNLLPAHLLEVPFSTVPCVLVDAIAGELAGRTSPDNRLLSPRKGMSAFIYELLSHPNIEVSWGERVEASALPGEWHHVVWTPRLEDYFGEPRLKYSEYLEAQVPQDTFFRARGAAMWCYFQPDGACDPELPFYTADCWFDDEDGAPELHTTQLYLQPRETLNRLSSGYPEKLRLHTHSYQTGSNDARLANLRMRARVVEGVTFVGRLQDFRAASPSALAERAHAAAKRIPLICPLSVPLHNPRYSAWRTAHTPV